MKVLSLNIFFQSLDDLSNVSSDEFVQLRACISDTGEFITDWHIPF